MAVQSTLNPFRVASTAMPPNLLLMAKILALALLCTNHVRLMPDPFLPFITILDALAGPAFQITLKTIFLASAIALLLNQKVRIAALILGATLLTAVVSSKAYYGNNKAFCGVMLFLLGLSDFTRPPHFLRWQFSLVYFGAALNKILDPDWQSGVFFQHWAATKLQNPVFIAISGSLPPLVAGKIMCWFTAIAELATSVGLLFTKYRRYGLWMNVLFQVGLLEFTGTTFTMFFYGMQAATLIFITWPKHLTVIYDGDCGICNKIRLAFTRIDFDTLLVWRPYQSGIGNQYGITMEALEEKMHVVDDRNQIFSGYRAFQQIMFFQPWFWLAVTVAIALPPDGWHTWRRIVVALVLAIFLPIFNPIGESIYSWVAQNRRRIMPGSTCGLTP